MGKTEARRQLKFDTERVWTFTIYQNLVRKPSGHETHAGNSITVDAETRSCHPAKRTPTCVPAPRE